MFRGLEIIYFSLILPLKCHNENLSYDLLTSIHIGIIALGNAMLYVIFFQVCYRSEEMRKQSKTLGDWRAITVSEKDKQFLFFVKENNFLGLLKNGHLPRHPIKETLLFLLITSII